MNKQRRERLGQAQIHLEAAKDIVQDVRCEEEEALDNMPENLSGSERYCRMEDAISDLDDAISSIEDASNSIESAME